MMQKFWLIRLLHSLPLAVLFVLSIGPADAAAPSGYVLHIELAPALCKLDASMQRSRQCLEGYSLTVSGLMPEGVNGLYCPTSSSAVLSPVQKRLLMRIMPDENSQVRLWRSVGGCVSMNATQYFRMMVNLAEKLNMPAEVTTPTTISVNFERLKQRFVQLNAGLNSSSIQLSCSNSRGNRVLTKIQVCYSSNGNYRACRTEQVQSCAGQMNIQGSY
jgi:ribonuclease T2